MIRPADINTNLNLGQPTYVELITAIRRTSRAINTICYDECGKIKCDSGHTPSIRLRELAFKKPSQSTLRKPCRHVITQALHSKPLTKSKTKYQLNKSSSKCTQGADEFIYLRPNARRAKLYRPDGYSLYYRPTSVFLTTGDGSIVFSGFEINSQDNFVLDPCIPAAIVESTIQGIAISELQRLTLPSPSGGSYTITVSIGSASNTTSGIPYNATAQQLRVRLGQLGIVGGINNVLVTGEGTQLDPFLIEFVGSLGVTNVNPIQVDSSGLIGTGTAVFRTVVDGTKNSKQRMTIDDSLQPYSLRFNGFTTITLPYNASLSQVQAALSALPSIGINNIRVTGLTSDTNVRYVGPLFFEFIGSLAEQPVPQMSVISSGDYIITTDSVGGVGLDEIQELSVVAKSGTFRVTMTNPANDNTATTGPIAYNASDTVVRDAVVAAMPWINTNNIVVSTISPGIWRFRFAGNLGKTNIKQSTVNGNNLSGAEAIVRTLRDGTGTSEEQIIRLLNVTEGTFKIQIKVPRTGNNQTTLPIPYNANAAQVQSALEALPGVIAGDIFVSGQRLLWLVTFNSLFGDVEELSIDVSGLICDPEFLKPVPKPPYRYILPKPIIAPQLPAEPLRPISDEANVSIRTIFQRDLFDPDLKIDGKKRTLRQISLISGYDPAQFNPYVRSCDNSSLVEAIYDTIIESQTNFMLIHKEIDTEVERTRILEHIGTTRQILPARFSWDCFEI